MNLLLYNYALKFNNIIFKFGYRVTSIDMQSQIIKFEIKRTTESISIDASKHRILGCEGVNSILRRSMEGIDGFHCTITPWTKEFRVLFSSPGIHAPTLDPAVHYILRFYFIMLFT